MAKIIVTLLVAIPCIGCTLFNLYISWIIHICLKDEGLQKFTPAHDLWTHFKASKIH